MQKFQDKSNAISESITDTMKHIVANLKSEGAVREQTASKVVKDTINKIPSNASPALKAFLSGQNSRIEKRIKSQAAFKNQETSRSMKAE